VDAALEQLAPRDQVLGQTCDVTQFEDVQSLWNAATQKFGRVDIWINNAGATTIPVKFGQIPIEQIEATARTKIMGALYGAHIAVNGMNAQGGGAVYFMEGQGTRGDIQEGTITLGAGNNAVVYLMKGLVKEYEGGNIIFGGIRPGINITEHLMKGWEHMTPERQASTKKIFNILGDYPETTAPVVAEKILQNTKTGVTIRWMTTGKMMRRFFSAPFSKRDLFKDSLE
jgi:NADP-dependent 3-hydroxy acid dehydrogenase YdfG